MITASPHLYRKEALAIGLPPETVERALEQAGSAERQGLPAILTLKHLAHLTGAPYEYLRAIVGRAQDGYVPFTIAKRSGGKRLIAAPEPILLETQRWVAKRILAKRPVHPASMAYAPGSSPLACANRHLGARWLVKLDIHDFFESISERRAYFVFRNCGYQALVAFELARLCSRVHRVEDTDPAWRVHRKYGQGRITRYADNRLGHLPQGAPTSPMLSNIVSLPLDSMLEEIASRMGVVYTRYSDDVTFSTGSELTERQIRTLIHGSARLFAAFGHEVHRKKIAISPPGARKLVLGMLVDGDAVRLSRAYRSRVETHIRGIERFGLAEHAAARHFTSLLGMVRHVGGLIAHARSVDDAFGTTMRARFDLSLAAQGWSPASP